MAPFALTDTRRSSALSDSPAADSHLNLSSCNLAAEARSVAKTSFLSAFGVSACVGQDYPLDTDERAQDSNGISRI
jgi:hypothetical protein